MLTTEQISRKFNNIDFILEGFRIQLERISNDLSNKANITDMTRGLEELRELIRTTSSTVRVLEQKLAKVILPEATKMYLSEGEVQNFQSNFNALKAMMTKFDKLYKNLVAYQSNLIQS